MLHDQASGSIVQNFFAILNHLFDIHIFTQIS